MNDNPTRRALLLAAAAALAASSQAYADDLRGVRIGAIRVDVSPMRANAEGPEADWLAAQLPAQLRQAFAAYYAPGARGAATLEVRVNLVTLDASSGTPSPLSMFPPTLTDWIDGDARLIGPGGREIAHVSLNAAQHPTILRDGLGYPPGSSALTESRVATLGQSFAQWLPSKFGL